MTKVSGDFSVVYYNVILLALSQAMLITGVSMTISASALVGARLAPDLALATLPLSLQYMTTMIAMVPVSLLMQRIGRRPVFVAGALLGTCGVTLATVGILQGSFLAFALAGILFGMHTAVAQFYRFAAAEAVGDSLRSRAISLTLAGGVLAAFLGPNLARFTRDAMQPAFAASFMSLIGVTLFAALLTSLLRLPRHHVELIDTERRPLGVILRQPIFIVAAAGAMVGYGAMNLLMTATPLAMHAHHHAFGGIATVIQWHVVAMFLPSFFTGDLIRRFGVLPVMALGCLLVFVCAVVNLTGTSQLHFQVALICLGLGWNGLYVGATTLLTESYRPAEKSRVQGINDALVFGTVTISSLLAAWLLSRVGWEMTNILTIPVLVAMCGGLIWLRRCQNAVAGGAVPAGAE